MGRNLVMATIGCQSGHKTVIGTNSYSQWKLCWKSVWIKIVTAIRTNMSAPSAIKDAPSEAFRKNRTARQACSIYRPTTKEILMVISLAWSILVLLLTKEIDCDGEL